MPASYRYTIADAQVDVRTHRGVDLLGPPAHRPTPATEALPPYRNVDAAINGLCGHCGNEPHTERVLMSNGGSRLLCQFCSDVAQKQLGGTFMEKMRKWQLN